ncbi:MAG: hypothetical protein M3O15_04410 [Acidobacteriota bacterium]|nr:hypothetical protein [Acidobacteriota bacterium]
MQRGTNGSGEHEVRRQLHELLLVSKVLRERLVALAGSIPLSPEEMAEEDLPEYPSVETEIRATLATALHDHLDPMMEGFTAARYAFLRSKGAQDEDAELETSIRTFITRHLSSARRGAAAFAASLEGALPAERDRENEEQPPEGDEVEDDPLRHPGVARLSQLLEVLSDENRQTLAHLVQCPRCRTLPLGSTEGPDDEDDTEPFPIPVLDETLRGILSALKEDERSAPALYQELLAVAPEERAKLLGTPRFSSPALARQLLDRSAELLACDPRAAEQHAVLALDLLAAAPRGHCNSLRSLAECRIGAARRAQGDFERSEKAFLDAMAGLDRLALKSDVRAEACYQLGLLRQAQGRDDEALALLEHASFVFETLGLWSPMAEARLATGTLLVQDIEIEPALTALEEATRLAAATGQAEVALAAYEEIALAHAELGKTGPARRALAQAQRFLGRAGRLDRLRYERVSALVQADLVPEEAALLLHAVLADFRAEKSVFDAAAVALDLVRLAHGSNADILAIERALPPNELPPRAGKVLLFALRYAGHSLGWLVGEQARDYLHRARHNSELLFEPGPEPPAERVWDELDEPARSNLLAQRQPEDPEDLEWLSWIARLHGVRLVLPAPREEGAGTGPAHGGSQL